LYVSKDKVYAEYEGVDVLAWGLGKVKDRGSYRPVVDGRRESGGVDEIEDRTNLLMDRV